MRLNGTVVLVVAATAVSLGAGEIFLRYTLSELRQRPFPHSVLGWATEEYQDAASSNIRAPSDPQRVLFLGDSFLAGSGVGSLAERFPEVFQKMTNGKVLTQTMAAGGWGTDQQYLAYLDKGRQWRPDVVVLAYCANNDLANNMSNGDATRRKPYFFRKNNDLQLHERDGTGVDLGELLRRPNLSTLFRSYLVEIALYDYFSLTHFPQPDSEADRNVDPLYRAFGRVVERHEELYAGISRLSWSPQTTPTHVTGYISSESAVASYGWELFEELVRRLNAAVTADRARLVVMLLPVIYNPRDPSTIAGADYQRVFDTADGPFTFTSNTPRTKLQEITDRLGVAFFDPTAEFRQWVITQGLLTRVWPDRNDRHFSGLGHWRLANQFSEHWQDFDSEVQPVISNL